MTITIRRFQPADAPAVAALVAQTLRTTNAADYSADYLDRLIHRLTPAAFSQRAQHTHFYVFCDHDQIVGTGAIGPYWGSTTEMSFFSIFVAPAYQGRGIGRLIITTLEHDDYAQQARCIEIPASITARPFYERFGYHLKHPQTQPDAEGLYRLEKNITP